MFFAPLFLLGSVVLLAWLIAQWPGRAPTSANVAVATSAGFLALLALLAALLLLSMSVWMTAWTARGGDWNWGMGHTGRMMRWERSTAGSSLETDAAEVAVQIRDFDYAPRTISVRKGARVTWTNEDAVPHTATDRAKQWDTGSLQKGASDSTVFASIGPFAYYCAIHPSMSGTVIVRE